MDEFFWFKRVVGMVAQPLAAIYVLLGLALLMRFVFRWRTLPRFFLALACLVLLAASLPLFTRWTARTLEQRYEPFLAAEPARYNPSAIVVLGNGVSHPGDASMPALTRLNDTARARLVEGVRLAGVYPEAQLVVTGYGMGLENCADAMAVAAMELGVSPARVVRLADAVDTENEAGMVRNLVGDAEVLLVTSAVHMHRAFGLFQQTGVRAIPAPCDYIAPVSDRTLSDVNRNYWRPRGKNLSDSEQVWHEYLGLAYYTWLRRSGGGG